MSYMLLLFAGTGVAPKFPITFVYGANEVRYTFNVLKIELVVAGHS